MANGMSNNLSFREKGISRDVRRRIAYLAAVFAVSLVFFGFVLNYHPKGRSETSERGVIPILSMESGGQRLSQMHGYRTEMDGCYMRESLIPLGKKRDVTLIVAGDAESTALSYEIRSMDTERKIAEEEIGGLQAEDGGQAVKLTLSNLMEEGEEYLLVIKMDVDGQELWYYTRVMQPKNEHIKDCLKFASFFHETAIAGDATQLAAYLETDPDVDQETLSTVTIRSSLSQVSWKGFEGDVVGEPVVRFTEIGDDYAAIIYDYQRRGENGGLYNIEEYFKMRYTADRMYLLDYERTMEEIPEKSFAVAENVLTVGVTDEDFRYLSNDTGTVVAFVQAGELYEYNENTGGAKRIFGFRDEDLSDAYTNYGQHGIRILNIDENGALDFVVYGYMNAGEREGYSGISLYHYDAGDDEAREQAFTAVTRPYPILEASFSELLYKSANGAFYVMMDGTLTRIDARTAAAKEMLTGMASGQYAVSLSGRYIAWIDGADADDEIHVMDLEDESSFNLKAPDEKQLLKPLAFLEENLAYGLIKQSDIGADASGNRIYPCYKVTIKQIDNPAGEVLKEYQKPGYYVSGATANSYTLFLERVAKSENGYEKASDDTIQDSSGEPNRAVSLEKTPDEAQGLVTSIALTRRSGLEENATAKIGQAALSMAGEGAIATLDVSDVHENYYVYVGSRVTLASTKVTAVVKAADKEMGIVVDNEQHNIWKRTKSAYVNPFTNIAVGSSDADASLAAQALSAMLVRAGENVEVHSLLEAGQSPVSVLAGALKDATILDLTGCSLEEVLYFVSNGSPVYVRTGADEAVLIVGYDAANVFVYEPGAGATKKVGRNNAAAEFEECGDVYISYIE